MKHFITYQAKNFLRSLQIIPPYALYITWIVVLYAYRNVPILSSYANSAVVLFVIMTWISMSIFRLEAENEKHLLQLALRDKTRFLYGKWLTAFLFMLPLFIVAHFYPIVFGHFRGNVTLVHHLLSFYAHIGLGSLGILTGSFFTATRLVTVKFVWLLAAITVTTSLAASQIHEALPSWLDWTIHVLPPLSLLYTPLKGGDAGRLPEEFLSDLFLVIAYMLVAVVIIQKLYLRRER